MELTLAERRVLAQQYLARALSSCLSLEAVLGRENAAPVLNGIAAELVIRARQASSPHVPAKELTLQVIKGGKSDE